MNGMKKNVEIKDKMEMMNFMQITIQTMTKHNWPKWLFFPAPAMTLGLPVCVENLTALIKTKY